MGGLKLESKVRRCNYRVGLPGSSAWNYRAELNPGWSRKQIRASDQIKTAAAKREWWKIIYFFHLQLYFTK